MTRIVRQRHTRQLAVVWEAVARAQGHPTAEQVLHQARKKLPRISRGTVYRNLQKLVSQGRVLVIRTPDGVQRFDATTEPHDHFVCGQCEDVADVPFAPEPDATRIEQLGFVVWARSLTWVGVCPHCRGRRQPALER
ncbi:MAG: transcriptional repressor [Candidatus Binatia bacterium]|nr:MAG: transcriptional repressor [Candidatus Binatia bacterium]